MIRPSICALSIVALTATGCEDPPPPLLSTLPEPEPLMTLQGFCETVFGAQQRHLEARCSAEEKVGKAYTHLLQRAGGRVEQCLVDTQLGPSVETGRAQLPLAPAMRCAEALERVSWKTTMVSDDLSRLPACRNLVVGAQGDGASCSSSYDCLPGLWCSGSKRGGAGRCRPLVAVGQPCEPVDRALLRGRVTSCRGGAYCRVGVAAPPPSATPRRYEVRGPDGGPAPDASREEVLRQAEGLGVTGSGGGKGIPAGAWAGLDGVFGLRQGAGDGPWSPGLAGMGEPVGIGGRGLGVHGGPGPDGPGGSSRPGYGVSMGRLGPSPPAGRAKVRLGELTVSGRLPKEVVGRIVRQYLGRLTACYEQGMERDPRLLGRVAVRFVIGREGAVSSVGSGGDLSDGTVATCVAGVFRSIRFPKPEGGIVTVGAPIDFAPRPSAKGRPATAAGPPAASGSASTAASSAPSYEERPPGPAVSPNVCTLWQNLGAPCMSTNHCAVGMTCRAAKCGKARLGRQGDACGDHAECMAGLYCDGTCTKTKARGEDCSTAAQCRGACGAEHECIALCGEG
ncbi:MAG: AgmX/PglI C-terminal domain-containing protein [Deltaproteobacteria bacterium]|nr:AgmX/PglI C-terminal domain-containing protein [Deltaproteobacteria bacterium]